MAAPFLNTALLYAGLWNSANARKPVEGRASLVAGVSGP